MKKLIILLAIFFIGYQPALLAQSGKKAQTEKVPKGYTKAEKGLLIKMLRQKKSMRTPR